MGNTNELEKQLEEVNKRRELLEKIAKANYTQKAKKLTKNEKEAVNEFITKVILNLEEKSDLDKLESIILFGSAIYTKKHDDVDIAIITKAIPPYDLYTLEKNIEQTKIPDSVTSYRAKMIEVSDFGEVIENEVDLNGTKIHYLIMPEEFGGYLGDGCQKLRIIMNGRDGSKVLSEGKIKPISHVFMKAIFEDGLVLYDAKQEE